MRQLVCALLWMVVANGSEAQVIYVDVDAQGAGDGTSWTDAFFDLQDALSAAASGDEIWVAEGTYKPTKGTDRDVSFELVDEVQLYGGFDGTELSRAERDWKEHLTVLSGDIGVTASPVARRQWIEPPRDSAPMIAHRAWFDEQRASLAMALDATDNSRTVVSAVDLASAVLDGFEVTQGSGWEGAGLSLVSSSIEVANVNFTANWAEGSGGAVHVAGTSQLVMRDARLVDNQCFYVGAGIAVVDFSVVDLSRVDFEDNFVSINGGGLWAGPDTEVLVRESSFLRNVADDATGGLTAWGELQIELTRFEANRSYWATGAIQTGADARISACAFIGNRSTVPDSPCAAGVTNVGTLTVLNSVFFDNVIVGDVAPPGLRAGALVSRGSLEVVNATFAANEARAAGAILLDGAGPFAITNAIVWGNHAIEGSDGIAAGSTPPVLSHTILQDLANPAADADGNFALDPLFVDVAGGDLRLQNGSPAIDAGDTFALPPGFAVDLAGSPRYTRLAIDIGAYEALGPLSLDDPIPSQRLRGWRLLAAPNPFNPSTTIYYDAPEAGRVQLTIYDLAGRRVKALVAEHVDAGEHEVSWNGRDEAGRSVASGVYLYRLVADEFSETKRLVLVK